MTTIDSKLLEAESKSKAAGLKTYQRRETIRKATDGRASTLSEVEPGDIAAVIAALNATAPLRGPQRATPTDFNALAPASFKNFNNPPSMAKK
jgi:cytochrome c553